MTGDDPIATGRAVKRTEALLRDARAVLRRVDVLLATALAIEDPALPEIAALRDACDRLVAQLGWRALPVPAPRVMGTLSGRSMRRSPGRPASPPQGPAGPPMTGCLWAARRRPAPFLRLGRAPPLAACRRWGTVAAIFRFAC